MVIVAGHLIVEPSDARRLSGRVRGRGGAGPRGARLPRLRDLRRFARPGAHQRFRAMGLAGRGRGFPRQRPQRRPGRHDRFGIGVRVRRVRRTQPHLAPQQQWSAARSAGLACIAKFPTQVSESVLHFIDRGARKELAAAGPQHETTGDSHDRLNFTSRIRPMSNRPRRRSDPSTRHRLRPASRTRHVPHMRREAEGGAAHLADDPRGTAAAQDQLAGERLRAPIEETDEKRAKPRSLA